MNWEKKFTNWIGSKSSVVVHTILFAGSFALPFFGVELQTVLLFLTTIVSLEAIYLAIFIQMTVNENTESLEEVEEDIEEIQQDVDEIQQDVDEIQQDVDEIQIDVDEIEKDTEVLQKEAEKEEENSLDAIHDMLTKLLEEVNRLKSGK